LARHTYRILTNICEQGESKRLLSQLNAAREEFERYCRTFATPAATKEAVQDH
jgi:hypothetical protein